MIRVTLLVYIVLSVPSTWSVLFFRNDYEYIEEFDAFYKVHWGLNGRSWDSAFFACNDEDSKLFYPSTKEEWKVVKILIDSMTEKPNVTQLYLGVHDIFRLGEFITIDGDAIPTPLSNDNEIIPEDKKHCVFMDIETGNCKADSCEIRNILRPFICKRKISVEPCATAKGYFYSKENNKCYKTNQKAKTWQQAMQTCYLEGGVLTVIENESELEYFRLEYQKLLDEMNNKFSDLPEYQRQQLYNRFYYIGFHRMQINGRSTYYTVRGQRMQNEFYNVNSELNRNGNCGVLRFNRNLKINIYDSNCNNFYPFICEMSPKI